MFRAFLDSNVAVSEDLVQKYCNVALSHTNCTIKELRRLFLVEDLVDSLKVRVLQIIYCGWTNTSFEWMYNMAPSPVFIHGCRLRQIVSVEYSRAVRVQQWSLALVPGQCNRTNGCNWSVNVRVEFRWKGRLVCDNSDRSSSDMDASLLCNRRTCGQSPDCSAYS